MTTYDLLTVAFGIVIGFSLGLTGGGGSIFAVPMLIYGLGMGVREAVGVSLAAVGASSLLGAALRWHAGELELTAGLIFALAGMIAAPFGTRIGGRLPDEVTLGAFAILMGIVGIRMWRNRGADSASNSRPCGLRQDGRVHLTSKCVGFLVGAGLLVGLLSGILGVGGGFIIVPALILVTGIVIHRAITTSLMVISVICASGVTSYYLAGEGLPERLTAFFIVGGFLGMIPGLRLRSRLSGPGLNRVFAVAMWGVAVFLLAKNTFLAR